MDRWSSSGRIAGPTVRPRTTHITLTAVSADGSGAPRELAAGDQGLSASYDAGSPEADPEPGWGVAFDGDQVLYVAFLFDPVSQVWTGQIRAMPLAGGPSTVVVDHVNGMDLWVAPQ